MGFGFQALRLRICKLRVQDFLVKQFKTGGSEVLAHNTQRRPKKLKLATAYQSYKAVADTDNSKIPIAEKRYTTSMAV